VDTAGASLCSRRKLDDDGSGVAGRVPFATGAAASARAVLSVLPGVSGVSPTALPSSPLSGDEPAVVATGAGFVGALVRTGAAAPPPDIETEDR
jgi:hypothetical protein